MALTFLRDKKLCYLTTVGRVSGRPREIEIWFSVHRDRVYFLSGGRDRSDWVKNLRREPRVTLRIADEEFAGWVSVVKAGTDEDRLARTLVAEKYQRTGTAWSRSSLPIAIDIDASDVG